MTEEPLVRLSGVIASQILYLYNFGGRYSSRKCFSLYCKKPIP